MAKPRSKKTAGGDIFQTITYGTGLFCKKMAELKKVTQTKEWKHAVNTTKDICEKVGAKAEAVIDTLTDAVEKGTKDIGTSFKAGMDSVAEGQEEKKPASKAKAKGSSKPRTRVKKVVTEAEVEKAAPVEPALEKEIEAVTQDVTQV
ncbi:MAG: hypothetical protein HQL17_02950 [Candidatus Omnitrophica bacterium]|nr:hypothetical protein [Candidatus Omnitrophota bacterium]